MKLLKSLIAGMLVLVAAHVQGVAPTNGAFELVVNVCIPQFCDTMVVSVTPSASATQIDAQIIAQAVTFLATKGVVVVSSDVRVFGGAK